LKREDRVGMFVFISILLFLLVIKWYLVVFYVPQSKDYGAEILASMEYTLIESNKSQSGFAVKKPISHSKYKSKSKKKKAYPSNYNKKKVERELSLFVFDPNTISGDSLNHMGLSNYVVNNIKKYRAKGGQFRKSDDLMRIYGMDSLLYEKINPYIKIKAIKSKPKPKIKKRPTVATKPSLEFKSIDINTADTTEFKKIKGIGSVYARRIVKFRNSLGGYFSTDQIKEVWGISDSLFVAIKPFLTTDSPMLEKKNINKLEKEEMVKHPYIDWKKAKIILKYKKMHGDYKSMDDFRKMHGLSAGFVDTLTHYFIVQ